MAAFTAAPTGKTLPTSNITNTISDAYPNPSRTFKISEGIEFRNMRDFLPVNSSTDGSYQNDKYLEFIIHPGDKTFLNLERVFLELKLQIQTNAGARLNEATHAVSIIDGIGTSIISRCSVYLNGVLCESSSYKGISEYIRSVLTMSNEELHGIGRGNFFKSLDTQISDKITEEYFAADKISADEASIVESCRKVIHTMSPLRLDISSAETFLLDNVELRIRLDLQPNAFCFLTHQDIRYQYKIEMAKLHVETIIAESNALLSLNQRMLSDGTSVEYIIDRPAIKTQILMNGSSGISVDDVFTGLIPSKLYVFMIAQDSLRGSYSRNPLHLAHCDLKNIRLDINGNSYSYLTGEFPDQSTHFFINSLLNINSKETGLTRKNFINGRTILVFDLGTSNSSDTIEIERRGNLRLELETRTPVTENVVLFMVGVLNGVIFINSSRAVNTSFLM